jgi:ABC-type transporter Mla subunit MlaD
MNDDAKDFKTGLFILAAVALLVTGLLAFGGAHFLERTVTEETYVAGNVNGIEVGAPVTLSGVRVGKVTGIDFTWNPQTAQGYIRIQFDVLARTYPVRGNALTELVETQVRDGLRARVETQGLVGSTLLALEYVDPVQYPALRVPSEAGHIYIPSAPSQFNQLLSSMETSLRKLSQFDLEKLSRSFNRDLVSADNLLSNVDAIHFSQIGTNIDALVSELRALGVKVGTFVEDADGTLKRMDPSKVSRNADELVLQIQATVHQLDVVLARFDVDSLNDTLANVRRASVELEGAMRELKQYPSGFLFGAPPPPAKALLPPK